MRPRRSNALLVHVIYNIDVDAVAYCPCDIDIDSATLRGIPH